MQWQVQESELLAQLEERWCQEELPRATTSSFLIPRGIGPASLCLFEAGMETEAGTENISRTRASLAKTMNSRHLGGLGACTPSTTELKTPACHPSCCPEMLACLG